MIEPGCWCARTDDPEHGLVIGRVLRLAAANKLVMQERDRSWFVEFRRGLYPHYMVLPESVLERIRIQTMFDL